MPAQENKVSLLSKSIKKAPKKVIKKTTSANGSKMQSKVGLKTSKRMQEKIQSQKKEKINDDEEIASDSSEGFEDEKKKKNDVMNDPFLRMDEETVEEKRLRMTQQVIQEYQQPTEEKKDFFENLQVKAHMEETIMEADDDQITRRMKMHLLEQKGKLFYSIADDFWATGEDHFEQHFMKGHKKAITCMQWMPDSRSIITGSKDCSLIHWDLESQSKQFFRGSKFSDKSFQGHNDEVVCCAISPNGKYLVSGGKDRMVRVWDVHNKQQIQSFMGHRDTITDVCFDTENDQFYTVSNDRALKVWNLREMTYMDSHYGHHANISGIDAYTKDRVISCGMDRQVIFWKVNEDSELLYKNQQHSVDTINVINNQFFITGSSDNCIDLWIMNKKKPVFSMGEVHDNDSWVLSTANVRNSDLFASGSYDGQVNFYKLNRESKNFSLLGKVSGLDGCINAMKFSHHSRASGSDLLKQQKMQKLMLAVSHSKDEKHGRWHPQNKTKHGITIIKKKQN